MRIILHRRKRNRKRRVVLLTIILLIFLLFAFLLLFPNVGKALLGKIYARKAESGPLEGPYPVAYIYDGDTLAVMIDSKEVTIRMIGIDTPESVNRDQSKNTPEGMEVSLWLHDHLNGRKVWLEYDEQRYDRYGRDLAYVWLDEGETMVEDELIRMGMALTLPMEPNIRYSSRFGELERQAKNDKAGFWGTGFFK